MAGSNTFDSAGVYGTEGTAAAANVPSARETMAVWPNAGGNAWIFGGYTFDDPTTNRHEMNDLWKYPTKGSGCPCYCRCAMGGEPLVQASDGTLHGVTHSGGASEDLRRPARGLQRTAPARRGDLARVHRANPATDSTMRSS